MAKAIAAVVLMVVLLSPPGASASEHVVDGDFDGLTTCTSGLDGDCTSPAWTETLQAPTGFPGPLCQVGTGSCGEFLGVQQIPPRSGTKWVQMGGYVDQGTSSYSISQAVNIPAAGAALSFWLARWDTGSIFTTGSFSARIDGATLFSVPDGDAPAYAPVTVDVGSLTGLRTLTFEASTLTPEPGTSDAFALDDISLVDAPAASAPPAAAPPRKKRCGKRKKLRKGKCVKKRKKRGTRR